MSYVGAVLRGTVQVAQAMGVTLKGLLIGR